MSGSGKYCADFLGCNAAELGVNCDPVSAIFAVWCTGKTWSVDIRKSPEEVFADTCAELERAGLSLVNAVWLLPYHVDHAAIVCERV